LNITSIFGLSFGALRERKLRSALTILMVVIGVALMTSLNGLGAGMDNYIDDQLGNLGANILIIIPSQGGGDFGPPQGKPTIKFTSQTVKTIERIRGVEHVAPFYQGVVNMKSCGEERAVTIRGIDLSKEKYIVPQAELESGSLVSTTDSVGMVLGYQVANPSDLDKPFVTRGQTVTVEYTVAEIEGGREKIVTKEKSFQVKGIWKEIGSQSMDTYAYVSPAAANQLLNKDSVYDGIIAVTRHPDDNDVVEERIHKAYGKNVGIISPKALAETIKDVMEQFTSFIGAVALVSMLVGAVGIVTTLYTSVMERTREIGLLKAIGYSNTTILLMFLTESMAIGFLGAISGLIAGIGASYALIQVMIFQADMSPFFKPTDMINVFLLAFILSIMAGLYPAWRASRLSPIVALRKE